MRAHLVHLPSQDLRHGGRKVQRNFVLGDPEEDVVQPLRCVTWRARAEGLHVLVEALHHRRAAVVLLGIWKDLRPDLLLTGDFEEPRTGVVANNISRQPGPALDQERPGMQQVVLREDLKVEPRDVYGVQGTGRVRRGHPRAGHGLQLRHSPAAGVRRGARLRRRAAAALRAVPGGSATACVGVEPHRLRRSRRRRGVAADEPPDGTGSVREVPEACPVFGSVAPEVAQRGKLSSLCLWHGPENRPCTCSVAQARRMMQQGQAVGITLLQLGSR
mmetsp:Transcript_113202/g.365767  ORF Transcript_113202/g.365767 Transcript_113202/m.365767 type:complete len:274 (-) Transcript_113202:567-1388(-)